MLIVFLVVYVVFLAYNLGYMSPQWDELPHLNGPLLLIRGHALQYMQTYGYYPPLYDIVATGFFQMFGASVTVSRMVAVMFALLSVWVTFEIANRMYGP